MERINVSQTTCASLELIVVEHLKTAWVVFALQGQNEKHSWINESTNRKQKRERWMWKGNWIGGEGGATIAMAMATAIPIVKSTFAAVSVRLQSVHNY